MKTIFDKTARTELAERISKLDKNSEAQWGKMNVGEMLEHDAICEAYYQGNEKIKRPSIGRLFGSMALKSLLNEQTPFRRNAQTLKQFRASGNYEDIEAGKAKWIALLDKYECYPNEYFKHWFFGKMSKEQVGKMVYKHADHHLKQFGC